MAGGPVVAGFGTGPAQDRCGAGKGNRGVRAAPAAGRKD